jgi:hypothetical protein
MALPDKVMSSTNPTPFAVNFRLDQESKEFDVDRSLSERIINAH